MKKVILLLIVFIVFGCENEVVVENYPNSKIIFKSYSVNKKGQKEGIYEEFYRSGQIKKVLYYSKDIISDTAKYFSMNGKIDSIKIFKNSKEYIRIFKDDNLISDGWKINNKKTGIWNYYSNKSIKEKSFEYIDLCNQQYLNQGWFFDSNGKIIKSKSNFLLIKTPSKVKINDTINIAFEYIPKLSDRPTIVSCQSIQIDEKFCNLRNINLDTIITLTTSFNRKVLFTEKGKYNIRGFIEEHNNLSIDNPKDYKLRHVYYNIFLDVN